MYNCTIELTKRKIHKYGLTEQEMRVLVVIYELCGAKVDVKVIGKPQR